VYDLDADQHLIGEKAANKLDGVIASTEFQVGQDILYSVGTTCVRVISAGQAILSTAGSPCHDARGQRQRTDTKCVAPE
jgi:hypothetical protein